MSLLTLNDTQSAAQIETPRNGEAGRQISRAVAHDLNNLLTVIHGYSERLLHKRTDEAVVVRQLMLIRDAARNAAVVVRECSGLNFSGKPGSKDSAS